MRTRGYWVLVGVFLFAHFLFRPLLVEWVGAPDLLVGGLLLASLRMRANGAAVLGFLLGLLEGSMALQGLGPLMIVFAVVGYAGARYRDMIFTDARIFLPLYLFVGTWLTEVMVNAMSATLPSAYAVLVLIPLTAASTTLLGWLGVRAVSPLRY